MAFSAKGVGMLPSTTGTGGILTYSSDEDTQAQIEAPGYWDRSNIAGGDLRARTAMEDFVSQQSRYPNNATYGGVIMRVLGSTSAGHRRAYVNETTGHIVLVAL